MDLDISTVEKLKKISNTISDHTDALTSQFFSILIMDWDSFKKDILTV